jgi:hypothetical protein
MANKQVNELESLSLTSGSGFSMPPETILSPLDKVLLDTLSRLPTNAGASYLQGLLDIANSERRSWRGTVAEFRETLREVLDHLAPDQEVTKTPDFIFEAGRTSPTMKQKVVFILKNRRARSALLNTARSQMDVIEEKTGAFVRSVYDRSSASTHGTPTREEAVSIKHYTALVLAELLQVPLS